MNRAEAIANIIHVSKNVLDKSDDFIELWLINALIDDEVHKELLGARGESEKFSVIRIDQPQFNQLNEPNALYDETDILINFGKQQILLNTGAIYRIAAPSHRKESLDACISGLEWEPSDTEGYITLNVCDQSQVKYFEGV